MKLIIDDLSKKFKDKWAVRHFHAELSKGVYALLGPNGSGKTTLMRMIANLLTPTSGQILLNNENIKDLNENYRDILGYLPQEFGVYKNFTAERFLLYFARLKGLKKAEAKEKVDEMLTLVNLQNDRKRRTGSFSGGMKRRLGIAQALLNDPKILIVDEPTAGLDPQERIRFRNLLSNIARNRIVFFSTHIVSDIEYIAKEILIMKEGQLLEQAGVQQLLNKLEDNVWEVLIQENELTSIHRQYKVGNIQRQEEGIKVRIVSDKKPLAHAKEVSPNLEDVYLHYFSESLAEGDLYV